MNEWLGVLLDIVLIVFIGAGIVQAVRLIRQLRDLRASRGEMDRFVRDFNGAVVRAEAGIKSLRAAARESGDDLEKLVGKAVMIRDELNFIVESADGVAERLSVSASNVLHSDPGQKPAASSKSVSAPGHADATATPPSSKQDPVPSSRAEKELLQALQKMK